MGYLQENKSQNLAARITDKGRKMIAQGNFNIEYFQIGDSEYDYGFAQYDGISPNPAQKVLMPFDKDSQVKYPYKVSTSTLTGTTFGTPIQSSISTIVQNNVDATGYVSECLAYSGCTGTTVECDWEQVDVVDLDGTKFLVIPSGTTFNGCNYVTIFMGVLGMNNVITGNSTSWVYKIVSGTTTMLELDRNLPNLTGFTPNIPVTVLCNDCNPDSWTLNTVWSQWPAGLDPLVDEQLSGYTSNVFVSSKEFFGYNTISGQTLNTGTTITNSFGDVIMVLPEEQHSLAIIHYSQPSTILPGGCSDDLTFKYEDYIDHTSVGSDYFEVYIPFLLYERDPDAPTGSTIGARFFMDTTDYYINSSATDTRNNQMKFRYLIDEFGNKVGKIFVNHQVIIFDDQEIVAAMEYKSNRRYTLPIPRISLVPMDSKCGANSTMEYPLIGGTGDTVFVSYLLEFTGMTTPTFVGLTGMHCNHYGKIVGTNVTGDIAMKFSPNDFKFMKNYAAPMDITNGYIANKFSILVQKVPTGTQPDPTGWRMIDFTSEIPGHTMGTIINPANLRNSTFVVTDDDYENSYILYDLEDYLGSFPDEPSSLPEFGDEVPFPGSIKLTRATDLEVMRYFVNLPSGDFQTTQNPSFAPAKLVNPNLKPRITEIALLNENKDVMVIAKAASPIERTGTQVLSVKIDI